MNAKRTVLVTGTSSGFGNLIARTLAEARFAVYATMRATGDRNAVAVAALRDWAAERDLSLEVVELDVTSEESVRSAAEQVEERSGGIEIVVNNAGVLATGLGEAFSVDEFHRVIDANVYGPFRVTRAFLPGMRERGDGLIVTVSSTMGRIVLPFATPYTASKWAVEGLFESWRYELSSLGIDTVLIEPGPFPTEMGAKSIFPSGEPDPPGYGRTAEMQARWTARFDDMFTGDDVPDPQHVADAVKALIETPKGKRPFRVVVDPLMAEAPAEVNAAHDDAQYTLMQRLGLSELTRLKL